MIPSFIPTNPVIPSPLPIPETPNPVRVLRDLLHKHLRISIVDGRVFLGTFIGTDQKLNLLLGDAEEFRLMGIKASGCSEEGRDLWDGVVRAGMYLESVHGRYVGQVLVPWKQAVRVEVYDPETTSQNNQRLKNDGMYL